MTRCTCRVVMARWPIWHSTPTPDGCSPHSSSRAGRCSSCATVLPQCCPRESAACRPSRAIGLRASPTKRKKPSGWLPRQRGCSRPSSKRRSASPSAAARSGSRTWSRTAIWSPVRTRIRPQSWASGCWKSSPSVARLQNSRGCASGTRAPCRRPREPACFPVAPPVPHLRRKSGGLRRECLSAVSKESSVGIVPVEQKSYEMPPRDGFTVAQFLTVADIDRSVRFYETVFGGRVLSRGDSKGAPGYVQIANMWLIVNVGGGPTPDKPSVTLSVLADPDRISSFMNIRVADIHACYDLWKSRGAAFITEPKDKYGETRCYIRDPDGYVIEVGQSKPEFTYG